MSVLDGLLGAAVSSASQPTNAQREIIGRIERLRTRLAEGVLRVAVLGQFKRGKSTLLNALLEMHALPTGVTPVTSIPIFIKYGVGNSATITFMDGKDPWVSADPTEISGTLARYVSEVNNPQNRYAVASVELALPSKLLSSGVILIDTPGIGSTRLHNTAAAEAVIPECDAAIFVLSADPPITAAEAAFLQKIRQTVSKVIYVLNKVDLLSDNECTSAKRFLFSELEQETPESESPEIFSISARAALEAKPRRDKAALESSGVPSLQSFISEKLAREKSAIVQEAGLRRSISLVGELLFQSEMEQSALLLPQAVLEEKRKAFEVAAEQFEIERLTLADSVYVNRSRLFRELQLETDTLWQAARRDMRIWIAETCGRPTTTVRKEVSAVLEARFEEDFRHALGEFQQRITDTLGAHQDRAIKIIASVRKMAADLMEIPSVDIHPEELLELGRQPYWVTPEAPPSVTNISTNALAHLLPRVLRARRELTQFTRETDAAVLRNVANLDWAIRQNITDSFRRFEFSFEQQLANAIAATREAMSVADQRHEHQAKKDDADIEKATRTIVCLSDTLKALRGVKPSFVQADAEV